MMRLETKGRRNLIFLMAKAVLTTAAMVVASLAVRGIVVPDKVYAVDVVNVSDIPTDDVHFDNNKYIYLNECYLREDVILQIDQDFQINDITLNGHNLTIKADSNNPGKKLIFARLRDETSGRGNVTIESGIVEIARVLGVYPSICPNGNLEIQNGRIEATDGLGDIDLWHGNFIVTGRDAYVKVRGILVTDGDLSIQDGTVIAGTDTNTDVGIYASGDISITGGNVTAKGSQLAALRGIVADGRITISGDDTVVNAQGPEGAMRSVNGITVPDSFLGGMIIGQYQDGANTYWGILGPDGNPLTTAIQIKSNGSGTGGTYSHDDDDNDDSETDGDGADKTAPLPKSYIEVLSEQLAAAIAKGGKQTVYLNEGTVLPNSIMKTLQDNPNLTLVFTYTYKGNNYKVTIPGTAVKADPKIKWYGPVCLYGLYKKTSTVTPVSK